MCAGVDTTWPAGGAFEPKTTCPKCGQSHAGSLGDRCPYCGFSVIERKPTAIEAPVSPAILTLRIALFTSLVTIPILVIDVVALWLLNLVENLDMWATVLFFEGLILVFFGIPPAHARDVYVSGRLAGVVLIIIGAFGVSQYY
jgi:hypothetical protein